MEMNFCRRCGSQLSKKSSGVFVCENQHALFVNGIATVSVFFLTDDSHVLLSIRGIEPYKGMYDSIGGFVDVGESLEQAVAREVKEELGLDPDQYEKPQYICSGPNDYPYGGEIVSIVGACFVSKLKPSAKPVPADDVADIKYVHLDDVDFDLIGNDDVKDAIRHLKQTTI